MNAKQCRDWLDATADCFPQLRLNLFRETLERLDFDPGAGFWEAGFSAKGGFSNIMLRYRGKEAAYTGWLQAAAGILGPAGLERPKRPSVGFPWLTLGWDAKAGRCSSLMMLGALRGGAKGQLWRWGSEPERVCLLTKPFRPRDFGDPSLAKVLGDFSSLSQVADVVREEGAPACWSLRLKRGLPIADFLRCDIAAAFTPNSSQLSFLMLDRRVTELFFDGETLWFYFSA